MAPVIRTAREVVASSDRHWAALLLSLTLTVRERCRMRLGVVSHRTDSADPSRCCPHH
jgi:hypothetical protein